MRRLLKIINNLVWAALFLFFLLVGATFLPVPGNYKAYSVQSGSMEPKIKMGSLIFVKPAAEYQAGDIITFNAQGGKTTVTHRVVEKKERDGQIFFQTKGDANEEADTQDVAQSAVVGKVFLGLPFVGFPVAYAKTKMGFIILILIPSIIIIYEELRNMAMEVRKKIGARRKPEGEKLSKEGRIPFAHSEQNIRILGFSVGIDPYPEHSSPLTHSFYRRKTL